MSKTTRECITIVPSALFYCKPPLHCHICDAISILLQKNFFSKHPYTLIGIFSFQNDSNIFCQEYTKDTLTAGISKIPPSFFYLKYIYYGALIKSNLTSQLNLTLQERHMIRSYPCPLSEGLRITSYAVSSFLCLLL